MVAEATLSEGMTQDIFISEYATNSSKISSIETSAIEDFINANVSKTNILGNQIKIFQLQKTFEPLTWTFPAKLFFEEIPKETEFVGRVDFSPEIEELQSSNELNRKLFYNLELELLDAEKSIPELQDYVVNVFKEQDLEMRNWEKVKISLKIRGVSFDRKLDILKIIDDSVKNAIYKVKESFSSSENLEYLDSFYKALFIKLQDS